MSNTDIEQPIVKRGPGRPPLRPQTEKQEGPRPTRRRRLHSLNDDRFQIPEHMIPPGMTVEWKTWSVTGQEQPFRIQEQRQQGWEPCQFEDFPELAPPGMTGQFVKEGLMLMMRPKELTEEFNEEIREANRSVIANRTAFLGQTPEGHLPRRSPSVKQTYEAPVPIED